MSRLVLLLLAASSPLWLGGCDQLGIESASAVAGRREAEGKAVGAGCRHAARSIEQCYESNKRADKAAVFAGWREMNDYMRENKIDAQPAAAEAVPADVAVAVADAGEGGRKGGKSRGEKADKSQKADRGDDKPARAERPTH